MPKFKKSVFTFFISLMKGQKIYVVLELIKVLYTCGPFQRVDLKYSYILSHLTFKAFLSYNFMYALNSLTI